MTASQNQNKTIPSVSNLLKATWELYRSHVSLFIGYSAWMLIPIVIYVLLTATFGSEYIEIIESVTNILDILIGVWVVVALIQVTASIREKKRINTRKLSNISWRLTAPFLLLSLILFIGTLAGLILFIIPGIVFAIYMTFSSVILVLEKTKLFEAMKKSYTLVRGRFWPVVHRLVLGNLALLLPYLLAMVIIAAILLLAHNGDVEALINSPATLIEQVLVRITDIILMPLFLVFSVLFYQEIRKI